MEENIDININKSEADSITLDPKKVYILSVKTDNISKEQLQHIRKLLEKTDINLLNDIIFEDVTPIKHAHWIEHERAEEFFNLIIPNFECSACHTWIRPDGRGKYCLECGAKMDEDIEIKEIEEEENK